ncbi:hypothetical protein [Chryseobacterium sp. FH1]|uniref:hypothetical protein n=1 Tax=Chryseobacterium sp. FH1 TaxID=1233951 RepID=UPI0004E2B2A5|nr:hypothetical protein [Chryseobacterium sp. FH1]KFC24159.1 hypothetical protein IO90_02310 [Chryseobacterium sp. FH1]
MKYSATSKDFNYKLKILIAKEKLFWFLTPKIFTDKPFCGSYDKDSFDLNLNTFIPSLKPFRIRGTYKKNKSNYNIEYEIDTTKASKIFSIIVIIISFFVFNLLAYSETKELSIAPTILIFGFALFGIVMRTLIINYLKRKFRKEFNLENIKQI